MNRSLPDKYQDKIDGIASREGLIEGDAYLAEWRWSEKMEREGSVEEVLDEVSREIEGEFDE